MKFVINTFFIMTISILLQNFISALPDPFSHIPLLFIAIISITLLSHFRKGFVSAVIGGIFLDIFSLYPFGIFTFSFVISVLIIQFISERILTNISLLGLILMGAIGVIAFSLLPPVLILISQWVTPHVSVNFSYSNIKNITVERLLWATIFLTIIWSILSLTTKRFKFFLLKAHS